jgi:predicted MFS family arabinose efflux permease
MIGTTGWRLNWILLGSFSLLIAILCWCVIRNRPEDVGAKPLGVDTGKQYNTDQKTLENKEEKKTLLHLGAIYFLFGFTYVIFVTFVVTTLINDYGYSEIIAGKFWFWFGLIGICSGPLFGFLSDTIGRAKTLLIVFLLQAFAHMLLALTPAVYGIYLSIFLFGICAWSVPSIMAATVGDFMGPVRAAGAFGTITLLFGIGQISGPGMAGLLAETTGSFSDSYMAASLLALFAGILSIYLNKSALRQFNNQHKSS